MNNKSLADWLSYLEQLHPTAIDMGLDRSRKVAQALALGRLAPRVVTVTGTNGKGSTCAFLARLLRASGLRVGVYSSPHLLRYNERVSIDGQDVDDQTLCEAFAAVEAARQDTSLTYFEMGTLAAFWLFARAELDAVILEVGLGGRLDAVNLVDADLALVTSIGLDHAEWLGNTRESVAFEKAGIFRSGKPALCGDLDPPVPLLEQAERLNAPLFCRGKDFDLLMESHSWFWKGVAADGEVLTLPGIPFLDLPMENAALALQAYALLDIEWVPERIVQALLDTAVVGRLDRRQVSIDNKQIHLLLDVGHNPHAAEYLARRLSVRKPSGRRLAVFGLLSDKDLHGVITPLLAVIGEWFVAELPTPRSRSAQELHAALRNQGQAVHCHDTIRNALSAAAEMATEDDEIIVLGSFYSVAEALGWLHSQAQGE
ncbi:MULTISPECIES: bifunctional tetrahydrofolate synthase/dihydrofolate synthase [Pseudomonas]|uniref:bifunctional tetrahydrofolate synthase/dihydrofolate synthase n=1 Tax=Pseudomonas TaxID=286 RepID=UPI000F7888F6|nr:MULTISPECIES: bifunctional tetrahydrofolate synthase/dihydrofolate synthase [Pseudomonas]RRW45214.1 bifunctional tetrahydrofolate synthase/dihydrofolate synthase [Pseudomonas luteola]